MGRIKVLARALGVSVRVKGALSIVISILGFACAFVPALLSRELGRFTNALQGLAQGQSDLTGALTLFGALVLLYGIQVVMGALQKWTQETDALAAQRYIGRIIMRCKCRVPYRYIENDDDFQKRVAFIEEYAGYHVARSLQTLLRILQMLITFVTVSIALLEVNGWIVAAILLTSIPAALLAYFQQDETIRHRAKWMEEGSLAIHYAVIMCGLHAIDALQEIRHFALFDYLKAQWRGIADEYTGKKNRIMAKHVGYNALADFLRSAVYIVVLLLLAQELYRNPALGLGLFTMVMSLCGQMQRVTGECLVDIMVLAQNTAYMEEFFHFADLGDDTAEQGFPVAGGDVAFEHVTFAYPGGAAPVLKDISVHIREGEKVAIVGENGSGKSTFIALLCGMFSPQAGRVCVGGQNVGANLAGARDAISVVFQDFAHYEASLRENITVSDGKRTAQDEEIMDMLRTIGVADVVEEQPGGLDEPVGTFGEHANNLSGGQWQKISLARAAWRSRARIMILDEPTAALDPMAEADLYRNFAGLTGERTAILISHRLGITSVVDRILVFHDGRIVEDGSHGALMAQNGRYAQMYRAQAQWYI